jgi:hypothetical protein
MTSDPLASSAPAGARELFEQMSKVCHGFSHDDTIVAALNIVVNAVRQNRAKRADAVDLYDGVVVSVTHSSSTTAWVVARECIRSIKS